VTVKVRTRKDNREWRPPHSEIASGTAVNSQ